MAGRGRPGAVPQITKRELYAALIARGVSNGEACRIVGINRRTGKYWRHGRTVTSSNGRPLHYPPVVLVSIEQPDRSSRLLPASLLHPDREISARFLSASERVRVADLHRRRSVTSRTVIWYRRRSTRRFTAPTSLACAGNCPRPCAPAGFVASRIAGPTSAAAVCST
jgi:hypothetical protein